MPYVDKQSPAAKATQRRASQKYYYANQEKEVARSRKWNDANKDRFNANAVKRRLKAPMESVLFNNAKQRARAQGIKFTITLTDIVVPEVCPMLGIPLVVATGHARDGSPSIDRIDPARGYVPGNIQIISHRANTIKSNATIDELRAVLAALEKLV